MSKLGKDVLYLLHLSVHGLVRGQEPELGRDPDTGGQVKYVIELARALGKNPNVRRVDLLTRKVIDPKVDAIYAQSKEDLAENVHIFRIKCGPNRYLRKEVLWPYMDVFVDQALQHIRQVGQVPDIIHGHYADAGYAGSKLAQLLGVPFVFTGHSLGRIKLASLLEQGMKVDTVRQRYNIDTRIEAEEIALANASMVVTSTRQERNEQYQEYDNYLPQKMVTIPPGVSTEDFTPPKQRSFKVPIMEELKKFLRYPTRPMVLTVNRPAEKKNTVTLVEAFVGSRFLRENCNLVLILGTREGILDLQPKAKRVIWKVLALVDKYDLYGQVAYPKKHRLSDIPDLYRIAAKTRGVFVNPAYTEPFGLTLIEAAASGLPVVSTNDGGPREIIRNCRHGYLIDPTDKQGMARKAAKLIADQELWKIKSRQARKGVRRYYSWDAHAQKYIQRLKKKIIASSQKKKNIFSVKNELSKSKLQLPVAGRLLISDIDNTLIGDSEALKEFIELLNGQKGSLGLGVASGRTVESIVQVLKENNVPLPEVIISAVGSEIHYGKQVVPDKDWARHINHDWNREKIIRVMQEVPGVELQPEREQRKFKVSYFYKARKFPGVRWLKKKLRQHQVHVKIIKSHQQFLDLLPVRASKGHAIRFVCVRWGLDFNDVLVAGDSGNDREMLNGSTYSVVVGNYSRELKNLAEGERLYFARGCFARGIIEGLQHFRFVT
ncbi:MAG: HAD-IIB family hydrolase [Desulfonatronovibrionaceae bacterium]